jgi:hypothetical protein
MIQFTRAGSIMRRHITFFIPIPAITLRCLAADPAAVSDLKQTVGPESWDKLITRLKGVNQVILSGSR